MKLPISYF